MLSIRLGNDCLLVVGDVFNVLNLFVGKAPVPCNAAVMVAECLLGISSVAVGNDAFEGDAVSVETVDGSDTSPEDIGGQYTKPSVVANMGPIPWRRTRVLAV